MTQAIETKCIETIRILAADVVQKSNSGHPGAPMGCAAMAHVLFSKYIQANPKNPHWINRDRFVLSNGHACALQYILLHLLGYDCTMDDLKNFRQLGSRTPGHPEANHGLPGIEVSTGPLGQGFANAVGLAMAEAHLAATFNREGFNVIDNYTYCIHGDGCLQEGVSAEAASLAGHLKLGRLIVLYDDNQITIDGDTDVSFTEDVLARFESYGWHTLSVEKGDTDTSAISNAIETARNVKDKPSLIKIRTIIGFGSLNEGKEKVHGAPLGKDDIKQLKTKLGFNPDESFVVPPEVYESYKNFGNHGSLIETEWNKMFAKYQKAYPDLAKDFIRRVDKKLPANWQSLFPRYTPSDPALATRKFSEVVINTVADAFPELVGGSADLTASNLTRWKSAVDFQHPATKLGEYKGRYIRFGVREHGMAAVCNGMSAYGGLIPFCSTFLNFISYALGAVRLSALSKHQVIYIMTHDSIGLGEDGPTHQPIETLAGLRALPNILNFRPADGNEVSGAYIEAIKYQGPSVIILSRQNLPNLEGSSPESVAKGAYVLSDATAAKKLDLILVATGSEVSLAVDSAKKLSTSGKKVRVVSIPSWELFEKQDLKYKESVFPQDVPVLSIEALSTFGWSRYAHASIGMTTFGASAPANQLFAKFGFEVGQVVVKAEKLMEYYKNRTPEWLVEKKF